MMPAGAERSSHNDRQESTQVEDGPQCGTVRPVEWRNEGGGGLPVSLIGKRVGTEKSKGHIVLSL